MYQREFKNDFSAAWICAPDDYLKQFDRPRTQEFPDAPFMWSYRYVRVHLRRDFTVKAPVGKAFLHFLCDNIMDVFLNGEQVVFEQKDTGCVEVSEFLREGDNLMMIRAYQAGTPDSFTSAITGGLRITYQDGSVEDIVSDAPFHYVRYIDFWETEEPEGWEKGILNSRDGGLAVSNIHAIAVKRSCLFRKDFEVTDKVVKATLCASALGCYEPHINGSAAAEAYFLPAATDIVKEYQVFDVTDRICTGKNTIAAIMGNGWYNCASWGTLSINKPALLMELTLEYADGRKEVIGTDETWKLCASPLTDNDLQFGERYDARLEIDGWDSPTVSCADWQHAEVMENVRFQKLLLQNYPFIRAKHHTVRFVKQIAEDTWLYDCGVNVAGAVELTVRNTKPGQQIHISVCERLTEDGMPEIGAYVPVYFTNDGHPDGKAPYNLRNLNVYTAKGTAEERYSPRFCYTGFRYVYIKGTNGMPAPEDIIVREMHTDLPTAGTFSCDDEVLNRCWNAIRQTWYNNCYNGPTDCPTREKNFWTGDTQIFSHMACWISDCFDMLARWTDLGRKMSGPYGWEDETYALPWTLYRFYGDTEILRYTYERMLELVEKRKKDLGTLLPDNPFSPYNDWLNPTGHNLSSTFFSGCWYLRMLDVVSLIAGVLGETETETRLRKQFNEARDLFNELHFDAATGEYDEKIQSAQVLPLAFGIVPEASRQKAADVLHRYLDENGYCLTTGFHGSRYLPEVLTDNGYGEDALKLFHQTKFPSWNDMLDGGATNITESWVGMRDPDKSISMCHFSLGASFAWFFEYLGGIRITESAPGLTHVVLEPHCFEKIGSCRVVYTCAAGEIISEWRFENSQPVWNYSVPEGVTVEARTPHVYPAE